MHPSYDPCKCGRPKRKVAGLCRDCRYAVGPKKLCKGPCGRKLPVGAFRIRTRANPKPRSYCRDCEALAQRKNYESKPPAERKLATRRWEKNNPEKHRAQILRHRIRQLGLAAEMDQIVAAVQAYGGCPICGTPKSDKPGQRAAIDHDHTTGTFRGIVCENCNFGLGQFGDDPNILRAAADYLDRQIASRLSQTGPIPLSIDDGTVSDLPHLPQRPSCHSSMLGGISPRAR